jgi:hypothetical protein
VLKAQKKADAEAARANVISLEEFLEVEVRYRFLSLSLDSKFELNPHLIIAA